MTLPPILNAYLKSKGPFADEFEEEEHGEEGVRQLRIQSYRPDQVLIPGLTRERLTIELRIQNWS
mgnify:FL=1